MYCLVSSSPQPYEERSYKDSLCRLEIPREFKLLSRVPKLVSGRVRLKHHFSENFYFLPKLLFAYSVEDVLKCSDLLYSEVSRNY